MVIRALRLVALVYVGVLGTLVLFEKRFVYVPQATLDLTPKELGMSFEDVWLTADDGVRIHGWWLPSPSSARQTLLYCHGNAGNVSHRLDRVLYLQARLGFNVLLFDYRGYGLSAGSPDEEGTYRDARAAYRHLRDVRGAAAENLVLFGESLGCAVALQLASEVSSKALVLEAPFTSIRDMVRALFPVLPLAPFVRTRYDNLAKIQRITVPLLIVHGERDGTVPFEQGRRLFEAAPEPKRFFSVPTAGHNDVYLVGGGAYWKTWREFLDGAAMSEAH